VSRPADGVASLLATLEPRRNEGVFVYAVVDTLDWLHGIEPVATVREAEGWTVILRDRDAAALGLAPMLRCVWITLMVHSDLEAHGLTAVFSAALAASGIACNVVAGAYHDHLFVPESHGDDAMDVLRRLQADAVRTGTSTSR
jgi:uncharacterized protein